MSRRSFFLAAGIALALLGLSGTLLYALLRYEPGYYRRYEALPVDQRARCSGELIREMAEVYNAVGAEREWCARLTEEQINSYLVEDFVRQGVAKMLPDEISEPRVLFEPERMRLAFRYKSRFVSTVVSLSLRIWLPAGETNVVALQLERFQAGLLPFSAQWLLEQVSDAARRNNVEVSWYRHEGHPVALLRFQANRERPTLRLKTVKINQGVIYIHGRSNDERACADGPDGRGPAEVLAPKQVMELFAPLVGGSGGQ
jgi:hypothetical protein